jgi:hypothetical protein
MKHILLFVSYGDMSLYISVFTVLGRHDGKKHIHPKHMPYADIFFGRNECRVTSEP